MPNSNIIFERLNVLKLDRAKQFEQKKKFGKTGKILQHKLVNEKNSDYSTVMKEAEFRAKQGNNVEILPIIQTQEYS